MFFTRSRVSLCLVSCAVCLAGGVGAADYPTRPIRLLSPVVPGGGLDVIARVLAPSLTDGLGKPVIVDNRPGASGSIAVETTARAVPDGHTLAIISVSQVIHAEMTKVPYDMFRDLVAVTQVSQAPYVLTVYPGLPAKTVKDFIAYAKANPKTINYASSGVGTLQQLAVESLALRAGFQANHIPYKGVGQAFPDLVSGRTQMTMSSAAAMAGLIRNGGVRALAVTSAKRTAMLPDVPTMIEAGVPDFVVTQWHGIIAAKGTPAPVIARLYREFKKSVERPDVVSRLAADGTEPVASDPAAFAAHMKFERDLWVKVIRQAGIKIE